MYRQHVSVGLMHASDMYTHQQIHNIAEIKSQIFIGFKNSWCKKSCIFSKVLLANKIDIHLLDENY